MKVIATSDDPSGDGGVAALRKELGPVADPDDTASSTEPDSGGESDVENEAPVAEDEEEEAGMQRVIKYFTDRIPGAKFRVSRVIAPGGKKDVPGLIEKLVSGLQEAIAQGSGESTRGGKKKKTLRGGDDGSVELFEEAARLEEEKLAQEKLAQAQAEINAELLNPPAAASEKETSTSESSGGDVREPGDASTDPPGDESTSGTSELLRGPPNSAFSFMGLDLDSAVSGGTGEMTSSDRERLEAQARPVRVPARVTKARGTFVFSVVDPGWPSEGQAGREFVPFRGLRLGLIRRNQTASL